MNSHQAERAKSMADERQPIYKITVLDEMGGIEEELLFNDLIETKDYFDNWEDSIGILFCIEVVR